MINEPGGGLVQSPRVAVTINQTPPTRPTEADGRRLGYIDGLRGIAVLAVVIYHLGIPLFAGGFLGVDVFFVISGFVISRSLAQSLTRGDTTFLGYIEHFYRRRFWRLAPALLIMVVVVFALGRVFIPPGYLSQYNSFTAAGAAIGISNIVLTGATGGDYFEMTSEFNPFLHTWSLGVEEQFYLVFPLLFWGYLRTRGAQRGWSVAGASIVPVLAVASLALAAHWATSSPTQAFYLMPTRFWELAAGVLAWLSLERVRGWVRHPGARSAIGWVGLVVVIASTLLPGELSSPVPAGLLPVLGAVLILWMGPESAAGRGAAGRVLAVRPMAYIGRISYSLYLWHWPVIVLFRWTMGISAAWQMLLAAALAFLLAVGSYHFVERPFQATRLAARPLPVAAFAGAVATIALVVVGVLGVGSRRDFSESAHVLSASVVGRQYGWSTKDLPGHDGSVFAMGDASRGSLIIVGDSHADAYRGVTRYVAGELGYSVRTASHSGCGFTLLAPTPLEGLCAPIAAALDSARSGDVVLLANLRMPRISDQSGASVPQPDLASPAAKANAAAALEQLIQVATHLEGRGVKVIVDSPKPLFARLPYRCADWYNRVNPVCDLPSSEPRSSLLERARPAREADAALKAAVPSVVIWDVFTPLCPTDTCSQYDADGHPLYSDSDHLSGWGNALLIPSFEAAMRETIVAW